MITCCENCYILMLSCIDFDTNGNEWNFNRNILNDTSSFDVLNLTMSKLTSQFRK